MHQNKTLLIALLVLISCGGGGSGGSQIAPIVSQGGGQTTTPTAPVTPVLSYDELKTQYENYYEYSNHWGLGMIKASSAYARGATGQGVTIGITDSGLDDSHLEITASRLSDNSALSYSNYTPNTRQKRHGTMVTSVAAGGLDKSRTTPMHGVAFDADVLFIAIQLAEPDPDYEPVDLGDSTGSGAPDFTGIDNFFKSLFEVYNDYDVDIVNNSYGYSGNIIDYTEAQVRNAFPNTIAEMAQIGTPDTEKTIYVWAAGNAGGYADQGVDYSSPELFPGMAQYIPEIQGHSIAVVSVDENGQISSFSSRCGITQDYCLAAPGGKITAAYPTSNSDTGIYVGNTNDDNYSTCLQDNSCYAVTSGTSFASPFVAGGLAVISGYFEGQLGSHELVSRLFATANKKGEYSNKAVYGQGLMDLNAATSPIGQVSAMLSQNLSGPMTPASLSTLSIVSPSYGDAVSRGVASQSVIFFDETGAPFRRALGGLIGEYHINASTLLGREAMLVPSSQVVYEGNQRIEIGRIQANDLQGTDVSINAFLQTNADLNQFIAFMDNETGTFMSQGLNGSWALGIFQDKELQQFTNLRVAFNNPWLDFTANGSTVGTSTSFLPGWDISASLSSGRNRFKDNAIFSETNAATSAIMEITSPHNIPSIQVGVLRENDSNLGLSGSGAWQAGDNQITAFTGISQSYNTLGGKFFGSMYWGRSDQTSSQGGLIDSSSHISSSAFGMGFIKSSIFRTQDQLSIVINQPLRVEKGQLNLNVPIYRMPDKEVIFSSIPINLNPSGREINSKIEYGTLIKVVSINTVIGYKSNPYHMKTMKDFWYAGLSFNIKF